MSGRLPMSPTLARMWVSCAAANGGERGMADSFFWALVIVPAGGSLESKSEAFGHCKSYALRATLLHSSLTGGRNDDHGPLLVARRLG